jgi:hypothetical protein
MARDQPAHTVSRVNPQEPAQRRPEHPRRPRLSTSPRVKTDFLPDSYSDRMNEQTLRVLASGATELWADGVRPGNRLSALGSEALEAERPFHVAFPGSDRTVCGTSVRDLREYPIDFAAQEQRIRCPLCDERLGHPVSDAG